MSDALRKNYRELFNGYSLPGWKLDYGKLECMVSEADAELTALRAKLAEAERERDELKAHGGPISEEQCTLDELLEVLAKWKAVASGKTCVSFQNLCYGASSLWHQTHQANFLKVDRKPEELSRWVLEHANHVHDDFPQQVLGILTDLKHRAEAAEARVRELDKTNCEIAEALESRGFVHCCNGEDIGRLCDSLEAAEAKLAAVREAVEVLLNDPTSFEYSDGETMAASRSQTGRKFLEIKSLCTVVGLPPSPTP